MKASKKPETLAQLVAHLLEQDSINKNDLLWLAEIADSEIEPLKRKVQSLQEAVNRLQEQGK